MTDGTEQDEDNNFADFEIDSPSPKGQNSSVSNLLNISITSPATKLIYNVGDLLDISGLMVSGNYSDGSTKNEAITSENITGFDSTKPVVGEMLTITAGGQTTSYTINVNENTTTVSPSITGYTISDSVISPNNDGIKDTTSIDLLFSEDVKADVDIINSSGVKVRDFYSSAKVKNPDAKVWDGKDNSGAIVADGAYTVKIVITDSNQNSITDTSKIITVDTSIPVVNPSNDDTITSSVYNVSPLDSNNSGTISTVPSGISKSDFEATLTPATGATLDFSNINNPVENGDTVVVTSQSNLAKAVYTVSFDGISWSQGTVVNYTTDGLFLLDSSFFTNNRQFCRMEIYRSLYPIQLNELGIGFFGCGDNRPVIVENMSNTTVIGDYTIWLHDPLTSLGEYYEMHFDGSMWSVIGPGPSTPSSSDSTITSSTYNISSLDAGDSGTISAVPYGTSKLDFESALVKDQNDQTWDDSKIENPVVTGDTLVVTAQDRITKATYTITVNAAPAVQLKITTLPQTISVGNPSGVFTVGSQSTSGISTKVLTTTHVSLSSNSSTGLFSWASSGGSCDSDWTKTGVTISKNTANRSFCYEDSTPGTYTITASADGLSSDTQTVIVNP